MKIPPAGRPVLRALALMLAIGLPAALPPLPAGAAPPGELLLSPGLFSPAAEGPLLRYRQDRRLPPGVGGTGVGGTGAENALRGESGPAPGIPELPEGSPRPSAAWTGAEVTLTLRESEQGGILTLSRAEAGGPAHPLADFPQAGANPVLLYFLEGVVRAMAEATGGSPYYIRNRVRSAFAAAGEGAGSAPAEGIREVEIRPFAEDPNRARMGAFADLVLRLAYDPARPERILSLSADTAGDGSAYHDGMVLVGG